MTTTQRIEFFRSALAICARYGRSPQAAITNSGGESHTLRQMLKTIGGGTRLPRITEAEARTLARESTGFTYREILAGLSDRRRPSARSERARPSSRRRVSVERRAAL